MKNMETVHGPVVYVEDDEVILFDSPSDAASFQEPWQLENETGVFFDSEGRCLTFAAKGARVVFVGAETDASSLATNRQRLAAAMKTHGINVGAKDSLYELIKKCSRFRCKR